MNRVPVSSSNLQSVGYDPATHVLEIAFHSGGIYQYLNVPAHIHTGLMSAHPKVNILMSISKRLATLIARLDD
ncbi:KTSC domain-containing protein [Providencia stuartii]|uniref:KTSC domain-containing protein n=1 Tax=Providencia stuartii TaxID=588 RepID=UPI003AF32DC9